MDCRWICLLVALTCTYTLRGQADTLEVGVYESPPFVIYGEGDQLEGISIWLWEAISKDLDLPYRIIRYPAGRSLANLLDDLEHSRIDLSINPLTITGSRVARVDFSHPYYIGNLTVARKASLRWHTFIGFLRDLVTSRALLLIPILVGMVIFFGTIVWLIERNNEHFDRSLQGLLSSFWWSAVTMTTVGYGDKVPISSLGRFVAFLWMLCSIIIITIFTAGITSSLTVRQMAASDMTLQHFSKNTVGTVASSATEEYLRRNFFRNIKAYPDLQSGLKGLEADEVDYFIYDEAWLSYQVNNNPDYGNLELMPVRFNPQMYAKPLRKDLDHTIKQAITTAMIRLTESRDWQVVLEEYQQDRP